MLQVGDAEKFLPALGFESMGPFCFLAIEEDGGDKRLVQLELAYKTDGVVWPGPD